jgi:hypothetical protein
MMFDGRGQPRATWAAAIAAGLCGFLLLLSRLAGRRRMTRRR